MWRIRISVDAAGLALTASSATGQGVRQQREQTHFSAEDAGVQHPVKIPAEVMAILRNDERVRITLESENLKPEALPESWFSVAEVHLGPPPEVDYVVAAEGPLIGANVSPFWVFVPRADGCRLALFVSPHDLEVGRTRTNGYRELTTYGATASTVTTMHFHFDGNGYKESSEKTEEIK